MRGTMLLAGAAASLAACGDAGDDWHSVADVPAMFAVTDVWALSPTDVWFLDGSATIHRYDGASWSTLETPSQAGLGCIYALSATDVWLCAGSQVLRYDGAGFTALEVTSTSGLDGLTGLYVASPTEAFAIGDDAFIARYDGTTWTGTVAGSPFKASIWGSSANDVYALSTFDLVHFDGTTWTEVDLGPGGGGGDGQVWGTGASDVWVMTGSSDLAHYDGASWETIETFDFVGDLTAVWGPAPDDLWAVGSAGAIARYDGDAWTEVDHQGIGAPYLRQFVAIHGTSSTDVWAVGQQLGEGGSTPIIYHYEP